MKKLLLLILLNFVYSEAMEQLPDEQEIRTILQEMKAKPITNGELLRSAFPIVSSLMKWWQEKVTPSYTPEENELWSCFLKNASLTETDEITIEGISQQDLATLKREMGSVVTTQEIFLNDSSKSYKEKAQEALELLVAKMVEKEGITLQELYTKRVARNIVEHIQRKKGIIKTIEGLEAPPEVLKWVDETYIPFRTQLYLYKNNEDTLTKKIAQLMADQTKE